MYAWIRANADRRDESRRTPKSSSSTRRARRRSVRSRSRCGASSDDAAQGDRPVARGALHVPDEAAEDQRHRRRWSRSSCTCRRCRSIATRKSSPPAARSRRRRRKPKVSPTSVPRPGADAVSPRGSRAGLVRASERQLVPRNRPRSNSAASRHSSSVASVPPTAVRRVDDDDRRAAGVRVDVHEAVEADRRGRIPRVLRGWPPSSAVRRDRRSRRETPTCRSRDRSRAARAPAGRGRCRDDRADRDLRVEVEDERRTAAQTSRSGSVAFSSRRSSAPPQRGQNRNACASSCE